MNIYIFLFFLKSQAGPVPRPAIDGEQLPPALVLFAEVLGDAAADLCQGTSHHLAKVSLTDQKLAVDCTPPGGGGSLSV